MSYAVTCNGGGGGGGGKIIKEPKHTCMYMHAQV